MERQQPIRILSIDGGGIRGLIPAVLLCKFEELLQEHVPGAALGDYFDLFAGTSTGAIIVSGLLVPGRDQYEKWRYSAKDLIPIYREWGPLIFKNDWKHKLRSGFGLRSSKYPSSGLDECMQAYFGKFSLSRLQKPTLIPAFDVEHKKAWFFTQHDACVDFQQDFYLRDVVRSTTAAPTYFEAATIYSLADFRNRKRMTLIDGGVFAHNPALCAYAEARAHHRFRSISPEINASNMILMSIGTGNTQEFYTPEQVHNWGLMQWARPLIGIMMGGAAETVDYQLSQVFGSVDADHQYQRFDPLLPAEISPNMDDASPDNIKKLIDFAEEYAEREETRRKFEKIISYITETDKA